ncbi:HAMP domain-containing sensor histidine kinase [Streptomyces sp. SL13]|uniref:histidine kinase n=1 Tax=Streptantibioticus silvisoli TaxID=2705255 RepID=A0AA90HC99_9ACTN|nr:HAMP domain-containing sensor histidine kinase [Streptantibioticus silvisoli]MDI5973682.1 HAMP domain-containing sensor histidine kinase [Streptantibioticus silvisoli]
MARDEAPGAGFPRARGARRRRLRAVLEAARVQGTPRASKNPARDAARSLRLAARGAAKRPGGLRDRAGRGFWTQLWDGLAPVDPYRSIKAALGFLVITSVVVTTLLVTVAIHSDTELRVITVFSLIISMWLMQYVATWLTSPLREMTAVARAMAHGDYSRRVRTGRRRDELGDLAAAFNSMSADLGANDRHRKELVANVSHELRTPISGLRALLENVVDGISEADPETMRAALAQTERLGRLVADLLDLSRLDSGVVPLRAHSFEVWPFLSGVLKAASIKPGVAMAARSGSRSDVHLHLDVSPPELTGYADPERLHQVISNLVDNAVKHSPPSGRVTVRARRGPTPDSLQLEVEDEGPGIPQAQRLKVFERFSRGAIPAPHGSGSDGGTGLGLAIARWAVELHGGRIQVAETVRGCCMHLTLPGKSPSSD